MSRESLVVALMLALSVSSAAVSGCTAPHPYVREGNANSVEITYSGDVASTLPLAARHCAQFERKPQLTDAGTDVAIYDCVRK
jgi:hypothetical protein